jgi:hypothetical protein
MDTCSWIYLFIVFLIITIFIIVFLIILSYKGKSQIHNMLSNIGDIKYDTNNLPFPYRNFIDESGNILNIIGITAFFRDSYPKSLFSSLKKNNLMIGITDIAEDKFHLTDDFDYVNNCDLWLTCFSNPEKFKIKKKPTLSVSESDFYDIESQSMVSKKYDFIYICNKDNEHCSVDGWNAINRNFELAQKCFPILCNEFGLKGLVVGRTNCGLENQYKGMIEVTDYLKWDELQNKMRQCRFIFVPNIYDASPRVIGECISKGLYILVNQNIMGGCKYVSKHTGYSFLDQHDIKYWLTKLLKKMKNPKYNPRKWWSENYGKLNSAKRLRDFIFQHYPDKVKNCKYVYFKI